jgi:thiamine biosynthesis lipoprotein
MWLRRRQFRAMGSPCAVQVYAETTGRADALIERAIAEVQRLEAKYTRYRDDSVTSTINARAGLPGGTAVDDETAVLLDYAATAYETSGGRFDITSGVLREVWDFRSGRVPGQREVQQVLDRVGWSSLRWQRPRIELPIPGMQLDFGGYVKEYAADRAAQLCRDGGCHNGLIDLGGDLAVVGPHPDGSPWRVGIRDPRADDARALTRIDVFGGGVASSGDYERFMVVDGVRYGHVLDPRTGWPVSGLAGVTVLASHCLIAGTASTVAMLHGHEGGRWLDDLGLPHLRVDLAGEVTRRFAPQAAATTPRTRMRGHAPRGTRTTVRPPRAR